MDPSTGPSDSFGDDAQGVTRRCDIVKGDCSIYSDLFWELQARFEPFEIETGVYPYPPECMEAWARGEEVGCITAVEYLYPDGTLGGNPWLVDPDSPKGWRFYGPDPPCEVMPGDCSIYNDQFWDLLEKYKPYEVDGAPAVYSEPPDCTEAGGVCPQVITYLYPDGTLGSEPWVVDPDAPEGWRLSGPPVAESSCGVMPGNCSIYSEKFWDLQAKYEPYEMETAVYPEPPDCTEAGGLCPQVITYLYPDGELGDSPWQVDPCHPKGWRFWSAEPASCP